MCGSERHARGRRGVSPLLLLAASLGGFWRVWRALPLRPPPPRPLLAVPRMLRIMEAGALSEVLAAVAFDLIHMHEPDTVTARADLLCTQHAIDRLTTQPVRAFESEFRRRLLEIHVAVHPSIIQFSQTT